MQLPKQRLFGLDFVRAISVLLVVFHHTLFFIQAPSWFYPFGRLGGLAVEVLLVLSGYLIASGLIRKSTRGNFSQTSHLADFFSRRWLRTLPPYYLYLCLTAALFAPLVPELLLHKEYFFFLQNFAWPVPSFYAHTWTLAVLEFFYLVFPLVFFLVSKVASSITTRLFVPIAFFMMVPITLRIWHVYSLPSGQYDEAYRMWVVLRLDTPMAGVLLALAEFRFPSVWDWVRRHYLIGVGAFTGCAAYHYLNLPLLHSTPLLQVIFYPLVSISIALLFPAICSWAPNQSRFTSVINTLSQSSYSLYVSHYFAMTIGFCLLVMLGIGSDQWWIVYPLFIALIVFFVYPSYRFVEEPLSRLRERNVVSKSWLYALGSTLRQTFAPLPSKEAGTASR